MLKFLDRCIYEYWTNPRAYFVFTNKTHFCRIDAMSTFDSAASKVFWFSTYE